MVEFGMIKKCNICGVEISDEFLVCPICKDKMDNCEHEIVMQNIGNCHNKYTCSKCGFVSVQDSSD